MNTVWIIWCIAELIRKLINAIIFIRVTKHLINKVYFVFAFYNKIEI